MEKRCLVVEKDDETIEVSILEYERIYSIECERQLKLSPLSVATEKKDVLEQLNKGKTYLYFLYIDKPFMELEYLMKVCSDSSVYLSLGLANILIHSTKKIEMQVFEEKINAMECWELDAGKRVAYFHKNLIESQEGTIRPLICPENLKKFIEILNCINETNMSLRRAWHKSEKYNIEYRNVIQSIRNQTQYFIDLADKIDYPCSTIDDSSIFFSLKTKLVQVNSSLSYLLSQGLTGTSPLYQEGKFFSSHSLLGIGQLHGAITKIEKAIGELISKSPVRHYLKNEYQRIQPEVESGHTYTAYDKIKNISGKTPREKSILAECTDSAYDSRSIVYVSGRLGYRWSEFSVTIPASFIFASGRLQWTLTTLSHEMLHCHVDGILGVLLGDADTEGRNLNEALERCSKEETTNSVFELIQKWTIEFCWNYHQLCNENDIASMKEMCFGGSARKKRTVGVLKDALVENFTFLNEIYVHVMDINYFFFNKTEFYIQSIWLSWSAVPSVVDYIDQYIVRTLVSVASASVKKGRTERFVDACEETIRALEKVECQTVKSITEIVIERIKRGCLVQGEKDKYIWCAFTLSLPLADLIVQYLICHDLSLQIESGDIDGEGTRLSYPVSGDLYGEYNVSTIPLVWNYYKERFEDGCKDIDGSENEWLILAINTVG